MYISGFHIEGFGIYRGQGAAAGADSICRGQRKRQNHPDGLLPHRAFRIQAEGLRE